MALTMYRTERYTREYDVASTLPGGVAATLTTVDMALLPPRTTPTAATVWTAVTVTSGVAAPTYAAPDADPTDALVVPVTGADAFMRSVDGTQVKLARIERIDVQ